MEALYLITKYLEVQFTKVTGEKTVDSIVLIPTWAKANTIYMKKDCDLC